MRREQLVVVLPCCYKKDKKKGCGMVTHFDTDSDFDSEGVG